MTHTGRIPPAGYPLRVADALAALVPTRRAGADEAELADRLARRLGVERLLLFSSGRAALVVFLRALRERAPAGRDVLLVPGFACPSLLAAAHAAGLLVRCVDVDPSTFCLDAADLSRESGSDALALVAVHLLGVPERMTELGAWARPRGVALIDDAAQGLGGARGGRALASFGDAGVLSFGRGKPLPLVGGGALVAGGEVGRAAERAVGPLPRGDGALKIAALAAGYAIARRPRLFAIAERMPGLEVGVTRYDPRIEVARFGAARARLGLRLLDRFDDALAARRRRWDALAAALLTHGAGAFPPLDAGAPASCLRFPFVAPSAASRHAIVAALRDAGIGASRFYPEPLSLLAERHGLAAAGMRATPGADLLAERLVTIPLHDGLPLASVGPIAERVAACLDGAAPPIAAVRPERPRRAGTGG